MRGSYLRVVRRMNELFVESYLLLLLLLFRRK